MSRVKACPGRSPAALTSQQTTLSDLYAVPSPGGSPLWGQQRTHGSGRLLSEEGRDAGAAGREILSSMGCHPRSREVVRVSLGARLKMSLSVPVSSLESSYCCRGKKKDLQCHGSCLGMLPAAARSAARQR